MKKLRKEICILIAFIMMSICIIPTKVNASTKTNNTPFFYKSGSILSNDSQNVEWSLNINNMQQNVLADVYMKDNIGSAQEVDLSSFYIQINGKYNIIFKGNQAVAQFNEMMGEMCIYYDQKGKNILIDLPQAEVSGNKFTIKYKTKIINKNKPYLENGGVISYQTNKDQLVIEKNFNVKVKNILYKPPLNAVISVQVNKKWVGIAKESVTVDLFADAIKVQEAVLNKNNNWQYVFKNLKKYNATGSEINYTVSEQAIPGYKINITGNYKTGFIITNTLIDNSKPNKPNKPNVPAKPNKPNKPNVPAKPNKPNKPNIPAKPSNPNKPNVPAKPSNPNKPNVPAKPSNPNKPNVPAKPSKPNKPNVPVKPSNPNKSNISTKPNKLGNANNLPATGIKNSSLIFGLILMILGFICISCYFVNIKINRQKAMSVVKEWNTQTKYINKNKDISKSENTKSSYDNSSVNKTKSKSMENLKDKKNLKVDKKRQIDKKKSVFLNDKDIVGKIIVLKTKEQIPIIYGATKENLKSGAVLYENNIYPGENGTAIILGHREITFGFLENIKIGDKIEIQTIYGNFKFKLKKVYVVNPDSNLILKQEKYAGVTLDTCYPFHYLGSAPKRFLAKFELIKNN